MDLNRAMFLFSTIERFRFDEDSGGGPLFDVRVDAKRDRYDEFKRAFRLRVSTAVDQVDKGTWETVLDLLLPEETLTVQNSGVEIE